MADAGAEKATDRTSEPRKRPIAAGGGGAAADAKKHRPPPPAADRWKIGDGQGGTSVKDALKKEDTKKAVSSIASKLKAPKTMTPPLEDKRKDKMGTFSASLTREQIEQSQARHKEKMQALGKAVPMYMAPRGSNINR